MHIDFFIPWVPVPKQGDRAGFARTKEGKVHVRHFPSTKVVKDAQSLAALMLPYRPDKPLEGPLGIEIDITYPWRGKDARARKAGKLRVPKATQPDYDNLGKQVGDVMERLGFFERDGQISDGRVLKWHGEKPGLCINLRTIT